MRKTGIGFLVAAYILALYTWLAAHTYDHAQRGATMLATYATLWPVALACALALNGLVLALIPIRRCEKWAIWLSAVNLLILLASRIATDPRCLVVLDPHQHGCHAFVTSMVLGLVGLALAAPRRSKSNQSGAVVQIAGYRKEKRRPQTCHLQLSSTTDVLATESALTENVSSHGMRVRTGHSWKPGTQALVKSSVRELWTGARIVYCQSLSRNSFALGLELLARADTRNVR
jgi:MFS family permease